MIKAPGKRKGQSYDLSPTAAEALQQALVSRTPHSIVQTGVPANTPSREARTLEDVCNVDNDYDDEFIYRKMRERIDVEQDLDKEIPDRVVVSENTDTTCMHANKSAPRARTVGGKKGFWHVCKDCQALIKPMNPRDRAAYTNAKAPAGTNVGTHASEDRKRD